jgi:bifunctional non-homologous end joining protein LigD
MGDPMAAIGFRAGARGGTTGPLSAYIAKRDGDKTPEPVPKNPLAHATPAGERPRFVIQEHHATRLHWDFRLEHDGVYASWAVPRGVPATPGRNNLAVQTEDHPLEYGSFEGSIPHGEYGAGTVTIWDDGRYDLEKWRDDEIILTAEGRPGGPLGRARLALIRTDGEGEKSTWLLHRMKTDAAGLPQPDAVAATPSEQADVRPPRDREVTVAVPRAMLSVSATPGIARAAAQRWGAWTEIKWDGMRALGVWDGERLRLYARSGADATSRYPDIVRGVELGPRPLILDVEIVAMDASGRPSFTRLQQRMNLRAPDEIAREVPRTPVQYVLFDALPVGDEHAAPLPLRTRRELLEEFSAQLPAHILVPPVFDDVDAALETSSRLGLEGVVVKDPASSYQPGVRSPSWLKVKHVRTQEVVIGGMRPGRGGRSAMIGSLLVGVPTADGLHYCGRVGSGLSERALATLLDQLAPLVVDTDPFADTPAADASDAIWVQPTVVAEVEFAEWSPTGTLRQARWRGLRPDKSASDVVRED